MINKILLILIININYCGSFKYIKSFIKIIKKPLTFLKKSRTIGLELGTMSVEYNSLSDIIDKPSFSEIEKKNYNADEFNRYLASGLLFAINKKDYSISKDNIDNLTSEIMNDNYNVSPAILIEYSRIIEFFDNSFVQAFSDEDAYKAYIQEFYKKELHKGLIFYESTNASNLTYNYSPHNQYYNNISKADTTLVHCLQRVIIANNFNNSLDGGMGNKAFNISGDGFQNGAKVLSVVMTQDLFDHVLGQKCMMSLSCSGIFNNYIFPLNLSIALYTSLVNFFGSIFPIRIYCGFGLTYCYSLCSVPIPMFHALIECKVFGKYYVRASYNTNIFSLSTGNKYLAPRKRLFPNKNDEDCSISSVSFGVVKEYNTI